MKKCINLMVSFLLILGILSGIYIGFFSQLTIAVLMLSAIFLVASIIGTWWFISLNKRFVEKNDLLSVHTITDTVLNEKSIWLQLLKPPHTTNQLSSVNSQFPWMSVIKNRFLASYLIGIVFLGIGSLILLIFEESSTSRGIFGVLLQYPLGKGAAIAFSMYISISSLAFLIVGFLAFLSMSQRSSK